MILDLENIGIKIEDEDQAIIVLNSLPTKNYEHFLDTVMYGKESLTLEEVHNALMLKELKKKVEKQEESAGDGLLVRGKGFKKENKATNNTNKNGSNSKFKRRCFICNKTSHLKADCPVLKEYKFKKTGNADLVSEVEDSDGYDSESVLAISRTHSDADWIIDSGCSFTFVHPESNFLNTLRFKVAL